MLVSSGGDHKQGRTSLAASAARCSSSARLCLLFPVYSCALLRDILLQGRLYISRHWLCFYANLFGKDIKVRATSPDCRPTVGLRVLGTDLNHVCLCCELFPVPGFLETKPGLTSE